MPIEMKPVRVTPRLPVVGLLAILGGCGEQPDTVSVTEVDSAGIRIVTNLGSRVLDSAWSVSSAPAVTPDAIQAWSVLGVEGRSRRMRTGGEVRGLRAERRVGRVFG